MDTARNPKEAFTDVRSLWPYEQSETLDTITVPDDYECIDEYNAKRAKLAFDDFVLKMIRKTNRKSLEHNPEAGQVATYSSIPDSVTRLLVSLMYSPRENQIVIQELLDSQERSRVVYQSFPDEEAVTRIEYTIDQGDPEHKLYPSFGNLFRNNSLIRSLAGEQIVGTKEVRTLKGLILESVHVDTVISQQELQFFPSDDRRIKNTQGLVNLYDHSDN